MFNEGINGNAPRVFVHFLAGTSVKYAFDYEDDNGMRHYSHIRDKYQPIVTRVVTNVVLEVHAGYARDDEWTLKGLHCDNIKLKFAAVIVVNANATLAVVRKMFHNALIAKYKTVTRNSNVRIAGVAGPQSKVKYAFVPTKIIKKIKADFFVKKEKN